MALLPPLSGLLVSMVSWVLTEPPAGRLRLMAAKWQLTATGSEEQPRPMVPVKLAFEVRVTVTVAFCELAMVTVAGVTVTPNSTGVPETVIADEVEEPWSVSPL